MFYDFYCGFGGDYGVIHFWLWRRNRSGFGNVWGDERVTISALVVSLLLLKQKYYWLLILGCAVVAAVLIQLLIVGGSVMSIAVLYKIAAFAVYAYLVQLVRFMI